MKHQRVVLLLAWNARQTVKLGEEGTTWWGCEHSLQAREVPDARTGQEQKNDDLVLQPQEFNSANNQ